GRFNQGVLTGELAPIHPGMTPITTMAFDSLTGAYTHLVLIVDQSNLRLDPNTRTPRSDEYSIGVGREVSRRLAVALAYVHKDGSNLDRKSTRLNSSHVSISYAVFCLKKKN